MPIDILVCIGLSEVWLVIAAIHFVFEIYLVLYAIQLLCHDLRFTVASLVLNEASFLNDYSPLTQCQGIWVTK